MSANLQVKILPRIFANDPKRLRRFEREARMLAALNHPHIGAIYGVEEADGVRALVLELVEGGSASDSPETNRRSRFSSDWLVACNHPRVRALMDRWSR